MYIYIYIYIYPRTFIYSYIQLHNNIFILYLSLSLYIYIYIYIYGCFQFSVVVSTALPEIIFIMISHWYIFVHRFYIVSVATKDSGKGPGKITNIFTLIWGAVWCNSAQYRLF